MSDTEENKRMAQLVRIHEANCKIEYPTKDEANFRLAVMKSLGLALGLKAVRQVEVTGPVVAPTPRAPANKKGAAA